MSIRHFTSRTSKRDSPLHHSILNCINIFIRVETKFETNKRKITRLLFNYVTPIKPKFQKTNNKGVCVSYFEIHKM